MGRGVVGIVLNICVVALYVKQQGQEHTSPQKHWLSCQKGRKATGASRPLFRYEAAAQRMKQSPARSHIFSFSWPGILMAGR
jgi:hypothetical protein